MAEQFADQLAALQTDVDELKTKIDTLVGQIGATTQEISAMVDDNLQSADTIQNLLQLVRNTEAGQKAQNRRLDALEGKSAAVDTQLPEIDSRVAAVTADVENVRAEQHGIMARVTEMSDTVADVQQAVADIADDVAGFESGDDGGESSGQLPVTEPEPPPVTEPAPPPVVEEPPEEEEIQYATGEPVPEHGSLWALTRGSLDWTVDTVNYDQRQYPYASPPKSLDGRPIVVTQSYGNTTHTYYQMMMGQTRDVNFPNGMIAFAYRSFQPPTSGEFALKVQLIIGLHECGKSDQRKRNFELIFTKSDGDIRGQERRKYTKRAVISKVELRFEPATMVVDGETTDIRCAWLDLALNGLKGARRRRTMYLGISMPLPDDWWAAIRPIV